MSAVIGRALVNFLLMLMTKVLTGTRTDASIERQSKGAEKRLVTADACVAFTNAISFGCD